MRKMSQKELNFVRNLLSKSSYHDKYSSALENMDVSDMEDGGMGSIKFESKRTNRLLGPDISHLEFDDSDGVKVLAYLSIDNYGDLYELDIWKTNFMPLISLPE